MRGLKSWVGVGVFGGFCCFFGIDSGPQKSTDGCAGSSSWRCQLAGWQSRWLSLHRRNWMSTVSRYDLHRCHAVLEGLRSFRSHKSAPVRICESHKKCYQFQCTRLTTSRFKLCRNQSTNAHRDPPADLVLYACPPRSSLRARWPCTPERDVVSPTICQTLQLVAGIDVNASA